MMIHNISRFIAALALLATAQGAWAQWSGSGTSADPYKIASASDLAKIRTMVDGGTNYENVYFVQTADIDCSTLAVWDDTQGAGIGTASHPFKGRYDGGSHKITGLRITATNSQYAGLFGYIQGGAYGGVEQNTHIAEVHGVVLVNPTITITATGSEQFAGAIVGYAGDCSQIYDNTVIGGTVTYTGGSNYNTDNSYVGGIVARYGNSNLQRLSGNTVVGTTLSGAGISGGLVGFLNNHARFSGNFADASISGADFRTAGIKREGALVGYYNHYASSVTDVNYYHSASGLTAYGGNYTYSGSHSISAVADNAWVAPLYTVSAPGLTVSGTPKATYDGTGYYAEGAGLTIGTGSDDKVFSDFTATGAAASSLATDRRSATVTVGTADVTVSATLQTVSGTTADGLTWSLTQDNSGNYTRLTVGGNGAMQNYGYTTVGSLWRTTAPWGYGLTSVTIGNGVTAIGSYAFIGCQSLAAATIGSSVATIGQQAFDHCDALVTVTLPASVTTLGQGAFYNCIGLQRIDILHDGAVSLAADVFHNDNALQYITFPSPAALQANTTGNWSTHAAKLRVTLGNQLFTATTEGGTPAYQIATADDLRHLAAAVNATANISSGKTFRQTADIDLAGGGNFTPIGSRGGSYSFAGTYDGGGYTISGLTVSKEYGDVGLFGTVRGATVRNVILLSPTAKATTTVNSSVSLGALIGTCGTASSNLVENCHVVNPTVSSSSTDSKNYVGAIIGNIWSRNTTATNCYYYGGNATAACGYIENGAPVTNVCAAHLVTPADGVTIQTPMAADLGFTCDADNNGTPENYWRTGAQLTLNYTGTVPDGYTIRYTATNGGTISGSTLTMPDADLAVAMSLRAIPWSGRGFASDPYIIVYPSQLLLLAHRVNGTSGETANDYWGKYFKLGADITFTHPDNEPDNYAENYEAIGGYIGGTERYFKGNFDGDGHTVSGIRIRKTGSDLDDYYQGLFGQIGIGANIHDVHLTDARITGPGYVGGIAGYIGSSTISGCTVTDSHISITAHSSDYSYYGTIIGYNNSGATLTNNYYHGCTVNGTAATSGVGDKGADITANNGALPAYAITFGDGVSTTALASAPENGFVYNGVSYYREGLALPLASILGSEAPEGYTLFFSANGTAFSGNTYTVNATDGDVTINTTLQPCLALADAADNTAAITAHAGKTLAVALSGRTLYKDGSWNTLCLPFDISTESGTLSGDNVQAMTLNTTTSNLTDGTLTLNFTAAETIPAGTPFIIKWDESGTDITNPVFEGVTISNATNDATVEGVLTFTGTYAPVSIADGGDNTKLYLGAANKLYYPTKAMTIGTHRAYFQLLGGLTAGNPTSPQSSHVRAFNLNFGDDEATGIISVHDSGFMVNGSDAWYTLDGRRLDGQPTAKGLYIHGGKKVAIK